MKYRNELPVLALHNIFLGIQPKEKVLAIFVDYETARLSYV